MKDAVACKRCGVFKERGCYYPLDIKQKPIQPCKMCRKIVLKAYHEKNGERIRYFANVRSKIIRVKKAAKSSWLKHIAEFNEKISGEDYYADGFDGYPDTPNPHIMGSLEWYFWHEGYHQHESPPQPFAFIPLREEEICNPVGVSGQRLSCAVQRARKIFRPNRKIVEDDEEWHG